MRLADSIPNTPSIRKLTARFPALRGIVRSLTFLGAYLAWNLLFKFLSLALVTYFVVSSGGADGFHYTDVNEALGSSQLPLMALCAVSFVCLLRLFHPYTSTKKEEIFTPQRFETRFLPGFLHGAVLATGVTFAFLLSGTYRYLGFFVQIDQTPLAIATILLRIASIIALVYSEEFIFRDRILRSWIQRRPDLPKGPASQASPQVWHRLIAIAFTALAYVGVKALQFDLSWMQMLTLFLISIALGIRALTEKDFVLAAGFWSALLVVFHALLSLPILGNDFAGFVLIKYQALVTGHPASETLRFISGGVGGPLASFAFQLLIVLEILRSTLRSRRRWKRRKRNPAASKSPARVPSA